MISVFRKEKNRAFEQLFWIMLIRLTNFVFPKRHPAIPPGQNDIAPIVRHPNRAPTKGRRARKGCAFDRYWQKLDQGFRLGPWIAF
jgi:hypothetical protein